MFARFTSLLRVDPYLVALVFTVVLAAVFPASGGWAQVVRIGVGLSIAGLFFAYGVKLATAQVMQALLHWHPQALVFATTYLVFPILGMVLTWVFARFGVVDVTLATGMLFLTILPSTVQSSIAFTSIAKGNVGAALCSASVSNLLGVFLVPLLVSLLIGGGLVASDGSSAGSPGGRAVVDIAVQILLPFVLGQVARPRLAPWFERHKMATMLFDRGSILLVVYSAFSAGMTASVWSRISVSSLVWVALFDVVLLACVMAFTFATSRALWVWACGRNRDRVLWFQEEHGEWYPNGQRSVLGASSQCRRDPADAVSPTPVVRVCDHRPEVCSQRHRRRLTTALMRGTPRLVRNTNRVSVLRIWTVALGIGSLQSSGCGASTPQPCHCTCAPGYGQEPVVVAQPAVESTPVAPSPRPNPEVASAAYGDEKNSSIVLSEQQLLASYEGKTASKVLSGKATYYANSLAGRKNREW